MRAYNQRRACRQHGCVDGSSRRRASGTQPHQARSIPHRSIDWERSRAQSATRVALADKRQETPSDGASQASVGIDGNRSSEGSGWCVARGWAHRKVPHASVVARSVRGGRIRASSQARQSRAVHGRGRRSIGRGSNASCQLIRPPADTLICRQALDGNAKLGYRARPWAFPVASSACRT